VKSKDLIKILKKDPEAIVWINCKIFDEIGKVEYERESKEYAYFLLTGKLNAGLFKTESEFGGQK
jgi:hypothetical protein